MLGVNVMKITDFDVDTWPQLRVKEALWHLRSGLDIQAGRGRFQNGEGLILHRDMRRLCDVHVQAEETYSILACTEGRCMSA